MSHKHWSDPQGLQIYHYLISKSVSKQAPEENFIFVFTKTVQNDHP